MDKKNFTAILQVALLCKDGMGELELRQGLVGFGSNDIIEEGIKVFKSIEELKLKQEV